MTIADRIIINMPPNIIILKAQKTMVISVAVGISSAGIWSKPLTSHVNEPQYSSDPKKGISNNSNELP